MKQCGSCIVKIYFSYKSSQLLYLPVIPFMKMSFADKLCSYLLACRDCCDALLHRVLQNLSMLGQHTLDFNTACCWRWNRLMYYYWRLTWNDNWLDSLTFYLFFIWIKTVPFTFVKFYPPPLSFLSQPSLSIRSVSFLPVHRFHSFAFPISLNPFFHSPRTFGNRQSQSRPPHLLPSAAVIPQAAHQILGQSAFPVFPSSFCVHPSLPLWRSCAALTTG